MGYESAYRSDSSIKGKVRRRLVRFVARRPLARAPARAMISFTFDDAPKTAAEAGAQALEARGVRGTYYVAASLAGAEAPTGVCAEPDAYRRLAETGHEIACHTFSHLDCGQASGPEAIADVQRNAEAFTSWGAPLAATFAYPHGDVAPGPKRALDGRYSVLRAIHKGMILQGADLNQAPSVGIEGEHGEEIARRWIDAAARRKGWLILYTHDVREDPSPWGCTPQVLGRLIDKAIGDGLEIVTVAQGASQLGVRPPTATS